MSAGSDLADSESRRVFPRVTMSRPSAYERHRRNYRISFHNRCKTDRVVCVAGGQVYEVDEEYEGEAFDIQCPPERSAPRRRFSIRRLIRPLTRALGATVRGFSIVFSLCIPKMWMPADACALIPLPLRTPPIAAAPV
uniref:Uncharacterized protein n=1 Tax=Anopheles maculatus TaxID=74869 RepID=A0A182T3H9_9DIPT